MSIEILYAGLSVEPLSVDAAAAAVDAADCGAVVTFSGVVRNHDGGRDVASLSYSGHPTAERVMADTVRNAVRSAIPDAGTGAAGAAARDASAAAAQDAGPAADDPAEPAATVRVWAAHRLGPLAVGDPALVCAVAAPHRGQAFAVCSAVVDAIKAGVPIWKEQFFTDGSIEWVGAGTPDAGR
jgi:molybdopterin synthase catalytic subunit